MLKVKLVLIKQFQIQKLLHLIKNKKKDLLQVTVKRTPNLFQITKDKKTIYFLQKMKEN